VSSYQVLSMMASLMRGNDEYEILARGVFVRESVDLLFREDRLRFPEAEGRFIQAQYVRTQSQIPAIFDGALTHVRSFSASDGHLYLDCQRSSYVEYVGTDNTEYVKRFGRKRVVNPLSCGAILKTSDQELIYGCRRALGSGKVTYGLPAGFVNPDSDRSSNLVDPFLTMQRELEEEIGILRSEIQRMQCLGLLGREGTHMVFLTEVAPTSRDTKHRLPRESELERLESIEVKSITKFLELNHDRILPHSLGGIVLYDAYRRDLLRFDA